MLLLVLARRRYSLRMDCGAQQSKASVDEGGGGVNGEVTTNASCCTQPALP